jgi:hypothetical protein
MASPAIYSKTILSVATGSGGTGTPQEINGITNISGPNFTRPDVDVSNMSSTAKEYKPAYLVDAGTLTFGLQYNPGNAVHQYIVSQSSNNSSGNDTFKILFSDNTDWTFTGSFTEFSITADDPSAGVLTANCSVRLSGNVNFNP